MDSPSALHPSRDAHPDEQTPTTPTQGAPQPLPHQPPQDAQSDLSSPPDTPTRRGFGALRGQRALPDEPLTPPGRTDGGLQESSVSLKRASAYRESPSMALQAGKTHDVDMGEGDEDNIAEDDGSDNDSATSEGQPPSKKKKGQRFFCTEFPPCQLSFTRSEHLARHIRKHTGERPFQCHCSRRFSRLDNLRQHAQTVHVNEEIPGDSLAATSTRFQRQIRTDRVRPQSSRSRASTTGSSSGVHSRGHSRNLSNSSVGSTTSSMGMPEDTRRRPQPLAIANDSPPHGKLAIDTQTPSSPGQQYPYYAQSPTGYSTPTSTTFSGGAPSPRFSSGMGSPASTLSRSSFYNGARHGRRLSVPSASLTYQGGQGYPPPPPPPYFSPMQSNNSAMYSQNSSVFGSPTTTVFSHNRRESETELEYRRRTWHPGTNQGYTQRPATSGLSYHSTPDDHRPALSGQPAASQVTRLPGIESFDHAPPTSARQPNSPGVGEASPHPTSNHRHRPSDGGLHQNLTRLDIASANAPPAERQWQSASAQHPPQPLHFQHQAPTTIAPHQMQHHSMPEPPSTSRKNKRQAWYGGPVLPPSTSNIHASPHRPSPEDSGSSDGAPTPSASLAHEFHPVIVNPHGSSEPYPLGPVLADERKIGSSATQQHQPPSDQDPQSYAAAHPGAVQQHPPHPHHMLPHPHPQQYPQQYPSQQQQTYALQTGRDLQIATCHPPPQNHDMGRLEALVAVATSEGRAAERS